MTDRPDHDVVVVGSGFGGSVAALRLAERGYDVHVYEAGRRFEDADFARTSWDVRRYLWAPRLGCYGVQRIHRLPNCLVLAGAGVGGGSLNYANTLYVPPESFFRDPQWAHITDWQAELAPHYATARRMLGVTLNPCDGPVERVMRDTADDLGVGGTYRRTPVGVFFGPPGQRVPDPYFGGAGPDRTGCTQCGNCMVGCRVGAKNTLVKNYLALAERRGVTVEPLRTVTRIVPLDAAAPDKGYAVHTVRSGAWTKRGARDRVVTASQVVIAAGAWEGVRYGRGSNLMGLLAVMQVDGGGRVPRWVRFLGQAVRHPGTFVRSLSVRRWSERTIIALVMQSLDNSITVSRRRGLLGWRLTSRQGHGEPNPTWIPAGNKAVRALAVRLAATTGMRAEPGSSIGEIFDIPMTAHFLGGAVISDSPATGVVDPYHRVWGYPGLHVVDGAAVSANLGVNPSLTITAQAERAMASWPCRGAPDQRPAQGEAYRAVVDGDLLGDPKMRTLS